MNFVIPDILSSKDLAVISSALSAAEFVDGRETAGRAAREVKHNQQLKPGTQSETTVIELLKQSLQRSALFQMATRPKAVHSVMVSKYEPGMSYGTHTDNAFLGSFRSDISFTIFLKPPSEYEGGELTIEDINAERSYKLNAGSMLVYPSSTLHRVNPVKVGCRLVAVGWVQSFIRRADQRETLFDLDTVRRSIFEKEGKSHEFDLISKSVANLFRAWSD